MFQQLNEGISFKVKVIPKASASRLVGWENRELKIRLKAIPEKGQANTEVIHFLASLLNTSKTNIRILRGLTGRHKQVCIKGMDITQVKEKLSADCLRHFRRLSKSLFSNSSALRISSKPWGWKIAAGSTLKIWTRLQFSIRESLCADP